MVFNRETTAPRPLGARYRVVLVLVSVAVGVLTGLVRRSFALLVEGLTAAARGPVVRVADREPAPRDGLDVVHARAVDELLRVPVDDDLDPVVLDHLVPLVDFLVQGHAVPEPRAAATGHIDPEVRVAEVARAVPLDELLQLLRRGFGQG